MNEFISLIAGIISLITLIVFFVMSSNIGNIRRNLEEMQTSLKYIRLKHEDIHYTQPFNEGELKEYLGKTQEALDCYTEAYFRLSKLETKGKIEERYSAAIQSKIFSLGGTVKEVLNKKL